MEKKRGDARKTWNEKKKQKTYLHMQRNLMYGFSTIFFHHYNHFYLRDEIRNIIGK